MHGIPAPFIVGSPRSGTTLLRLMLDAHPELAIPPETGFIVSMNQINELQENASEVFFQIVIGFPVDAPAWDDFHISLIEFRKRLLEIKPFKTREGLRLFYRMYAERFGKPRWGDKTPLYIHYIKEIDEILPEAHFIHLVRDGRDVATSLRKQWFSPGYDIATQAKYWNDNVRSAQIQGRQCRRFLEIRFEDLIQQTESTLRHICEYIQVDFHHAMLEYHKNAQRRLREHMERRRIDGSLIVSYSARQLQQQSSSHPPNETKIGVWRDLLQPEEVKIFEDIAGDILHQYGYS